MNNDSRVKQKNENNISQKNGKIEFLRFVFCMTIILFHFNRNCCDSELMFTDTASFFFYGNIGVEFFFLVTGYLFAAHCYKDRNVKEPIGKSTVKYMYGKWASVFPYHVFAFIITFVEIVLIEQLSLRDTAFRFLDALPNFFFIQKTGIYARNILGLEWYISVMLLSLFILYPICKKNYDLFTRVIAPLGGIFLVGYLCHTYGSLTNATTFGTYFAKCQIRGFAEICLGAFAFEVARFIGKYTFPRIWRVIFSIIEDGCYIFVLRYFCSTWGSEYQTYALYALLIGVCLTFSGVTYGNSIFQNKFVYYLGKLSLSMYLCQNFVRTLIQNYCIDFRVRTQLVLLLVGIFVVAALVNCAGDKLRARMKKIEGIAAKELS